MMTNSSEPNRGPRTSRDPWQSEHDIDAEPHLRQGRFAADPSEAAGSRTLRRETARRDAQHEAAMHSVHDELAVLTADHPTPRLIDRDFSCDRCGYNLRGKRVGEPCPECGYIQYAAPGNPEAPGYADWLQRKVAATGTMKISVTIFICMLSGGVLSVAGTFLGVSMAGVDTGTLAFIAFGPAMEELMKVLFVMILVETRPYLLRFGWSIWAATLSAALGFAAIENVLYTQVYFPDMPPEVVAFRWTACTALHVSATALATVGVAKMWRRTMRELRPAAMAVMLPWLAAAIVLHGAFNAFAIGAGLLMQG